MMQENFERIIKKMRERERERVKRHRFFSSFLFPEMSLNEYNRNVFSRRDVNRGSNRGFLLSRS